MNDEYILTIKCICFNHGKYLRRCLDSILAQKTKYKFKILIHDDASTDDSKFIIEEYCKRYPDTIKAIIQKENQYSKGINIISELNKYIDTKYACICECDDYWISTNKIESQVSFLENHAEYVVCAHSFLTVDKNEKPLNIDGRFGKGSHDVSLEEVIMDNCLPQTATLMYRQKVAAEKPSFYNECEAGDYPFKLYLSTSGKMYYIDEIMTCYRRHGEGSWVTRAKANPVYYRKHVERLKKIMSIYNENTRFCYSEIVKKRIEQLEFRALKNEKDLRGIKSLSYYKQLNRKEKIKVAIELKYPQLYMFYGKLVCHILIKKTKTTSQ